MQNDKHPDTITGVLSDGSTFEILPGKGKHGMTASRISGGDQEKYLPALMAQLITINGAAIVYEDLAEMPLSDYTLLMEKFAAVNFTLDVAK